MTKTILIVDDDIEINKMLTELLRRADYDVLCAFSGTEALLLLEKLRPDLILLDLMLPGLSGEEILPRLQGVPVIVLSAKAEVADKVALLLGGAADYMTKPFDTKELLARIEVQLRKSTAAQFSGEVYAHGPLRLNASSREVTAAGLPVALTKTEYAILKLLLLNPHQVLTKAAILQHISADTLDCTESTLKTHISHLRTKLRAATGRDWIESVWGIGFKLAD